jgi:hypothetical protein
MGMAGLAFLFLFAFPLNIILGFAIGYLAVKLYGFIRGQIRSRIMTHDDGISAKTSLGETISIPWTLITHSGYFHSKNLNKKVIFVYSDSTDQLLTIPDEYSDFPNLWSEIEEYISVPEIFLKEGQNLNAYLKELLANKDVQNTEHIDDLQ